MMLDPQGSAIELFASRMKNWIPAVEVSWVNPVAASPKLEKDATRVRGVELMHEVFEAT